MEGHRVIQIVGLYYFPTTSRAQRMSASWKVLDKSLTCQRYRSSHVFLRSETSVFNGSVHWGNVVEGRSRDLAYRLFWCEFFVERSVDVRNSLRRRQRRPFRVIQYEDVVAKFQAPPKSIGCYKSVFKLYNITTFYGNTGSRGLILWCQC